MSYSIKINSYKKISYRELLTNLNTKKVLSYSKKGKTADSFIEGVEWFFLYGKSTRGVELIFQNSTYNISLYAFASKEDYYLAFEIAKTLSNLFDQKILVEDEEYPLSISEFDSNYNVTWILKNAPNSAILTREFVEMRLENMRIPCIIRDFHIGLELIEIMNNESNNEFDFYEKACERIKKIQYLDAKVVPKEIIVLEDNKSELLMLSPKMNQLIIPVDYILLRAGMKTGIQIPFIEFKKYAIENFERLDEHQFLTGKLSIDEYEKIILAFEQYKLSPKSKTKNKWRFW